MPKWGRSGGRRENAAEGRRTHKVTIWLSDQEWVEITALAEAMGVTRPRVYTAAVESGGQVFDRVAVARERARQVDAQVAVRILAGVANNLNQLAHGANIDGDVDRAELRRVLAQVQELTGELRTVLAEGRA
ncbi:plasmid mobilization relaxosome protein MobC [Enemella evansiae]|uniref:plasmid mobilization relaxosome protein MobC n=1 Tax=Enemella evansiae TaxID=2016499 RepID=UPI001140298E|nr:plasmid mobilization relaxosome protein MobC [Enemella evansiae]